MPTEKADFKPRMNIMGKLNKKDQCSRKAFLQSEVKVQVKEVADPADQI